MIEIPSKLEGSQYYLYELELSVKPLGFTIGGNWDYDHGYFDYKLDDKDGCQYVRVPFTAVEGQLDTRGCRVEIERPFLLSHKYQIGLDDHTHVGNASSAFNQFSEPVEKDAEFPEQDIGKGKSIIEKLETTLL